MTPTGKLPREKRRAASAASPEVPEESQLSDEVVATGPTRLLHSVPPSTTTVTEIAVDLLRRGPTLRVMGEDQAHARLLAWTPTQLPPILVDRSTMTVIDGMHRVLAAKLRGEKTITVRFFEGSEAEAFVAAVKANIEHGRPLSLADREHAAERIMALKPEWSDRVIGEKCALSPKTVAGIRRRTTEDVLQLPVRTGRDGRARPLDPVPGRERIAQEMALDPDASLRQIAIKTGTSVGTVRDVRRRLAQGESPLPDRLHRRAEQAEATAIEAGTAPGDCWADDAALASTEEARQFARWMDSSSIRPEDCDQYLNVPPLNRLYAIIAEAQARSGVWARFAVALEGRARKEAARNAE